MDNLVADRRGPSMKYNALTVLYHGMHGIVRISTNICEELLVL